MELLGLRLLDGFFLVFHTALILFNLFGWISRRTRRWNFISLAITFASWFVMGAWHGIGTCLCTEWHWQVREALGRPIASSSYVQFLMEALTPWHPSDELVRQLTAGFTVLVSAISGGLNLRDLRVAGAAVAPGETTAHR